MPSFNSELLEKYPYQKDFIFKPRNRKSSSLVCGIGENDVEFVKTVTTDGKQVTYKPYDVWRQMLRRCYDKEYNATLPTYSGVSVDPQWFSFSKFLKDLKILGWTENLQLDKDLIVKGNKVYSVNTCACIPRELNSWLVNTTSSRGKLPLGVYLDYTTGKFKTQISCYGTQRCLGYFNSKEEAHREWQKEKLKQAIEWSETYPSVRRIVEQLSSEIANNLETKSI